LPVFLKNRYFRTINKDERINAILFDRTHFAKIDKMDQNEKWGATIINQQKIGIGFRIIMLLFLK